MQAHAFRDRETLLHCCVDVEVTHPAEEISRRIAVRADGVERYRRCVEVAGQAIGRRAIRG